MKKAQKTAVLANDEVPDFRPKLISMHASMNFPVFSSK